MEKEVKSKSTEMVVGEKYQILDSCGMLTFYAEFLGTGHVYFASGRNNYYKTHDLYYVFKKEDGYKYVVCEPVFNGLEFSHFRSYRYGNNLEHIFVDFRQPLFALGDEYSIYKDNFPNKYSEELKNSGSNGYFYESN